MLQCCQNCIVVPADLSLQFHELRDPAVLCPLDEVIQLSLSCIQSVMEHQPQFFLQKVCPIQAVVFPGNQFKLRPLLLGQVLRSLSESELTRFDVLRCGIWLWRIPGWPSRFALRLRRGLLTGIVPGGSADFVHSFHGPLDNTMQRSASGQYSSIQDWIHLAPSPETSCIEALCSFVSCLKNREKTPFPCPS